jgi:hypothetical protein
MTAITFQPQTPNVLGYVFCRPFYRGILIYWDYLNPELSASTVWGVEVQITNLETPTATDWVSCGVTQGSSMIITNYGGTTPLATQVLYQFRVRPVDSNRAPLDIWKEINLEGDLAIPISSFVGFDYAPVGGINRNLAAASNGINLTTVSRSVTVSYINEYPFTIIIRYRLWVDVSYTNPLTVTRAILRINDDTSGTVLLSKVFQVNTNSQEVELVTGVAAGDYRQLSGELLGESNNIQFGRTYLSVEPIAPFAFTP